MSFDAFSQEDGLPNSQIQCIYQDHKGWMWFGTSQGLSRFDGYEFVNFLSASKDSLSIKGNLVRVIFEDHDGNLLIGTEYGGVNFFDRDKEIFLQPYANDPYFKSKEISVNDICEGDNNNLWVATNNNIVIIDSTGCVAQLSTDNRDPKNSLMGDFVRVLKFDNTGHLWAGTNEGVFIIDPLTKVVERFDLPLKEGAVDEIWELFLDDDGNIWVGTYQNGAYIINPVTRSVQSVKLNPAYERTETVRSISRDSFGNYWIGTRGGLYIYSKKDGVIGFYHHDDREPGSLINNSILSIFHDRRGETWLGTRGGVNLLAKSKQVFRNFSAQPSNDRYLNSSIVYAFWIDARQNIWIGTEDGGVNIYHPKTGRYSYLMADSKYVSSISRNCIKAFLDDQKGHLWIGTFLGGIDVLDLGTGRVIKHYINNPEDSESLSDNRVMNLKLDPKGNIWVATWAGIDRFDPISETFVHFNQITENTVNWIEPDSNHNIWIGTLNEIIIYNPENNIVTRHYEHSRYFMEDAKGRFWVATLDRGIALYSLSKGALKYYGKEEGLSNNRALCILEDNQHNLWISTSNGLSKFNPETEIFQNYTSKDGLRNNQFSYGAAYKTKNGDFLFGGISGFNLFDPGAVKIDDNKVPLVLTEFKVFNKRVPIGEGEKPILEKSISETSHVVLSYDQKVFTFEFAALNYVNSESNLYSYYLEGFDKEWNEPSISRTATYTNLNPGDYTLHIKRVVPGADSSENELKVMVTILPPFWKTTLFLMLVLVVICVMIYTLIHFFIYREKIKNELYFERLKAKKLHELDMLKLKFFTNISHEIRTPLTLILAPLEKMISNQMPSDQVRSHLDVMYRNTRQLDRLVNQLLDFRKLESGNLKLELSQGDLVRFVDEIVHSFESYANEKEIDLKFNTLKKGIVARFDPDKIEKILNNLISNAIKYTDNGGKVIVNLSLIFASDEADLSNENADKQFIEIAVRDTGQGISQSNITKVFNRFFQANEKEEHTGTGIGLAFVKELVKLHKGKVFVVSQPGKGSKFTVRIPYDISENEVTPKLSKSGETVSTSGKLNLPFEKINEQFDAKILLVVEDNPDVRMLIQSHFSPKYKVIEAGNGNEGWNLALQTIPDVIVSDILMPDVDGYEFCKRIKKDERTSHIPVMLLTALHSKEHEIKGLTYGADDYITKPFDLTILQTKIENMLAMRDSLKQKYSGEVTLQPKNIIISSPDEKFLHKAVEVIEENISDPNLDIERFAQEVGVSRMQLYRKLNALTDMTVKEFIRHFRLKRASQLLLQDKITVAEVAYNVGFKDLSHFRKCFRQQYGMNATEYIKKNR